MCDEQGNPGKLDAAEMIATAEYYAKGAVAGLAISSSTATRGRFDAEQSRRNPLRPDNLRGVFQRWARQPGCDHVLRMPYYVRFGSCFKLRGVLERPRVR
ncbi:unnamed protein product [Prorocentrum cordatum]|uniref:Uncharacterized protein n=1 Tax=Prorocentrum cordatum TaxID=2364126 RepID=A0ABN9UF20_9DINO|nr:unnamed protein product [Polarella glacialis]